MRTEQTEPTSTSSAPGPEAAVQTPGGRCDRKPVTLSGHVTAADGTGQQVILFDLSYDGCLIEAPIELTPGERVQLAVSRRGAIAAQVRWCSQGKAGLAFDSDGAPALAHVPRTPRCSARVPINAEVTMRRRGGSNHQVRAFDLSPHGCKVELLERLGLDQALFVKFPGLEVLEAQVCWLGANSAGLRFAKPIHPAVVGLLMERLGRG